MGQQQSAEQGCGGDSQQDLASNVTGNESRRKRQCCQQRDGGKAGALDGCQSAEESTDQQQADQAAPAECEWQIRVSVGVAEGFAECGRQQAAGQWQGQQSSLEIASQCDGKASAEQAAEEAESQAGGDIRVSGGCGQSLQDEGEGDREGSEAEQQQPSGWRDSEDGLAGGLYQPD